MPGRSGCGLQHRNNKVFLILLFISLRLIDFQIATVVVGMASLPGGYTIAGRVAPFGKPPNEAAQVQSALQGPSIISSRCSCGSARVDFRYFPASTDDHDDNDSSSSSDEQQHAGMIDCHCPQCRRFHVSAFVRYLEVPENDVSVTGDSVVRFLDNCMEVGEVYRTYCRRCSTKLLTKAVERKKGGTNTVLINMGPIDDETVPEEVSQLWRDAVPEPWRPNMEVSWTTALPPPEEQSLSWQYDVPPVTVTGGCTCGACQYEFEFSKPAELQHCYCYLCRQLSGGPFMTWVPLRPQSQHFHWLVDGTVTKSNAATPQRASSPLPTSINPKSGGEAPLIRYTDIGRRHVCDKCGGVLSIWYDFDTDGDASLWLAAGGFDSIRLPFNIEPYLNRVVHICCGYKHKWHTLPDDGMERIDEAS